MKINAKTINDLNSFFKAHEITIIGDHELTGTITKFICMVNKDGTMPNLNDRPHKDLRMCVETAYHKRIYLERKHVFVIMFKQKQQPLWS